MSDHPRLVSIRIALERIAANRPSLEVEHLALDDCLGRTVAENVTAQVTVPLLDASAMREYAFHNEDVKVGCQFNANPSQASLGVQAFMQ